MSKISLAPNASGTGTLTIAAPNTNTDRTLTLPDATGTINTSGLANEVPAGTVSAPAIYPTGDPNTGIYFPAADTIAFTEGGVESMRIDANGKVTIGGIEVGYRNVPPVGTKTGSYVLQTADVGKYVQVSTGGSITIPNATFAEGDIISVFNNTTGNITITCSITTAYIAGTNSDKASVTLATRGVATILFISSTVCVISGNVS